MISLFKRDFSNKGCPAINIIEQGAEWVYGGEGIATQKLDGTACFIKDGIYYKRLNLREGRTAEGWIHWSLDPEQKSGHGWVPVGGGNEDNLHREASIEGLEDGTYELLGPTIQKNPEGEDKTILEKHGARIIDCPREYIPLKEWLVGKDIEGIVWHHEDGRMVKIKKSDFGLNRKSK